MNINLKTYFSSFLQHSFLLKFLGPLLLLLVCATSSFSETTKAPDFKKPELKLIKDPLRLNSSFIEWNKDPLTGLSYLKLNISLAKSHMAYFDDFKLRVKDNDKTLFSFLFQQPEVSPLIIFLDKFSKPPTEKKGFEGDGELFVPFKLDSKFSRSDNLTIEVGYKACTDNFCHLPKWSKIDVLTKDFPEEVFAKFSFKNFLKNPFNQNMSLALVLLALFLAGILTSLTPCILPLIPITLSILTNSGEKNGSLVGILYTLGLASVFSILGLISAITGSLIGSLYSQAWFLVLFSLVLVILGLQMLEFLNINIPGTSQFNQKLSKLKPKGYIGVFFSGALAGLVATPCVGPVLISLLLWISKSGSPFKGFICLFSFAIGFGMIFILMGSFKEQVLKFDTLKKKTVLFKKILGLSLILMGVYYGSLLFKATGSNSTSNLISLSSLEKKAQIKPIILDFYADWCASCLELEKITFQDPEVKKILANIDLIKVDLTLNKDSLTKDYRKAFEVIGLPTLHFLQKDGKIIEDLALFGYENPEDFIKRLKLYLETYEID